MKALALILFFLFLMEVVDNPMVYPKVRYPTPLEEEEEAAGVDNPKDHANGHPTP